MMLDIQAKFAVWMQCLTKPSNLNQWTISWPTLPLKEEVADLLDHYYCYNWACVDARIKGTNAPGGMDSGVVLERHYALNWLTKYFNQEWDNVKTDT
mmetsp:Transcript_11810/g.16379  ORF Transcript_11810/g.16379 Transcript_11810/m.16379 type:complete len:97 (-) Transcript_11810:11-301(-)